MTRLPTRSLWAQALNNEKFWNHGQADLMSLKNGRLVTERSVAVHGAFRPTGATFSNISGKETRALAFIDDFNRLQVSLDSQDLWRSGSPVGGGYLVAELVARLEDPRQRRARVPALVYQRGTATNDEGIELRPTGRVIGVRVGLVDDATNREPHESSSAVVLGARQQGRSDRSVALQGR